MNNLATIQRRLRRATWQPKTATPNSSTAYNHARFQFDDGSPASLAGHCYDLNPTTRPPHYDKAMEIEEYLDIKKEDAEALNRASSTWHYGTSEMVLPHEVLFILNEYERAMTTIKSEYPLHVAGHLHRIDFTRRMEQILDLAKPSTATTRDCEKHKEEVTEKTATATATTYFGSIGSRKNGNMIYQFGDHYITACCYYKAFEEAYKRGKV